MRFVEKKEDADIILVGFPVDQGTENKGCLDAPFEIRNSFENFYFSETGEMKNIFDSSDTVEGENFGETMNRIKTKISKLLENNKPIISIGGNHSITLPIIQGFSEKKYDIGIVFIDAHPDSQKNYFPFGDVIPKIVEQKIPIVMIGLRNWSQDEYNFLIENKIPFIHAKDFELNKALQLIKNEFDGKQIYVSLDIDAIDPGFAPGTGCIEPCGLTSRDVLELIKKIDNKIGFDLVEINPGKDINNITINLGAKLIFEIANNWKS